MDQNTNNTDDERIIVQCEKCAQNLRVPKSIEVLHITCPTCRHTFDYQPHIDQNTNNANDEKIIIQCEKCAQKLRVPKRKEVIHVTCTTCRHTFDYPYRLPASRPTRRFRYGLLIGILIILIAGYSVVRYFIDQSNYKEGHQAYQIAECATAIQHFDSIIDGWRLVDTGGYTVLAKKERAECLPFQTAVNKQKNGDFSGSLVAYADFVTTYNGSVLVESARVKSKFLFEQSKPSTLASQASCEKIYTLLKEDLIPQRDVNLPHFYFACGKVYDTVKNFQSSFDMYETLLTEYPNHSLSAEAETSLLANPITCEKSISLKNNKNIANRTNFMPSLYYHCGQVYDTASNLQGSFDMYETLLVEYPDHSLSGEAETALLANPVTCIESDSLQNNQKIAGRINFMPSLYYHCGQTYEENKDWANAVTMYENFLEKYPSHSLASDVKTALARSIVAQTKKTGAGKIPEPARSGSTGKGSTEVIIQNDSPKRLRIVFSGPESQVEELAACSSCTTYTGIGPIYCPKIGPIGHYILKPGMYDIVVESINDSGVTPWSGNWNLGSGDKYSSCFFLVTQILP